MAGYAFYTGRKFHAPSNTSRDFDTIRRRQDPREILVTDVCLTWNNTGSDSGAWWSSAYPYFNPHVDRASQAGPEGNGHELASDGSVMAFPFATASGTINGDSGRRYFRAYAEKVSLPCSRTDGPYFRIP